MAGFHKTVVLTALKDEFERAQKTTARKHDEELAKREAYVARIKEAEKRLKATLGGLQSASVDNAAGILNLISPTRKHSSYRDNQFQEDVETVRQHQANINTVQVPQLVRTRQERMLENVVKIVESYDGEVLTITTLRDLGVLEFVRVPKDAC